MSPRRDGGHLPTDPVDAKPTAMAINIVDTAPLRPRRPLGRWIAATLGFLFTLIGILLLTPLLAVITIPLVFWAATGSAGDGPDLNGVLFVAACTFGGSLLWFIGVRLIRGKPRTVLFLRRFGFDDAKQFVSYAAAEALGQRWRLVTLDDLETDPVTTKRWKRWMPRLLFVLAVILIVWLVRESIRLLDDPGGSAFDSAADAAREDADNAFEGAIAAILAGAFAAAAAIFAAALVAVFASVIVALAGAFGLASVLTNRSMSRAERNQWTAITTPADLARLVRRVKTARSKVFAPRIAVVRSVNPLWKQAVAGLATVSDLVLIDISDPSESLLWELNLLRSRPDVKVVLIGEEHKIRALAATGGHDRDDQEVLNLLSGQPVLVYGSNRRRFARNLRHMFDASASGVALPPLLPQHLWADPIQT